VDPSSLNLRHLKAVTAIVDSGSISAAARAVNLTQPAITQAIAKLEAMLDTVLFERTSSGMQPTNAGRILAARADTALRFVGSSRVTAPQMRAFIALARSGSYAGAAAAMGMREPSLHRAVTDLSLGLGQKLVERRGRGVTLTGRGTLIARRFRLANAELSSALDELERLRGREVGRIVIGAMPLSRAQLVPNAIGRFHKLYPDVDVAVVEGSYAEMVAPLRDGEIDLLLGALRDNPSPDLKQSKLFVDRPVIVGRSGHPLEESKPIMEALASYPWILPSTEAPLRKHWQNMFAGSGVTPPRVAIECGSVLVIRQLLMQDDYLTLLSPAQVAVELEAGWLARVCSAPGDPQRTIGLTCRSDWRPTLFQKCFLYVIAEEARTIGAARISKA
jgi:DNA-binding transcriptional LysR family regulator